VDSESLKTSAGHVTCGFFSIIVILTLIGFPNTGIHKKTDTILKTARPYKQGIIQDSPEYQSPRFKFSKNEHVFHDIILEASAKHGVDPALVKAVIMAESSYNHKAISKKGAIGLMQIMPATAIDMGVEDLFDPEHNVNAGVRYLKKLLKQFEGDVTLALAAYNAGSRKVRKFKGIPPYKATQFYIQKVFEYYEYYQASKV
jgi:soluble lytic murein transglycosylase-like protein